MDGFINLLKPPGVSSHDMVNFVRKEFKIKKVGHGGTLDPGAAGVLVIGVGKATRLLEYAVGLQKKYRAEITFGISTSSGDSFGEIVKKEKDVFVTEKDLNAVLEKFTGEIFQIPPMTSAIKSKGKKLYELARKGIEIERKPRKVKISSLKLVRFIDGDKPKAFLDIACSKGTYIRSLCHDVGAQLGCGAHMSFLVRTGVGEFMLDDALTPAELKEYIKDKDFSFLKPMTSVLGHLQSVIVNNDSVFAVLNGIYLNSDGIINTVKLSRDKKVKLLTESGQLLAIGKVISDKKNIIKPEKVFKTKRG
ncbi:MAG: tRNA pseudouridine55 synthase [Clostridia bacterium]|nr:tRNA pseudouridine55 synthase [Clostridia bacterium]